MIITQASKDANELRAEGLVLIDDINSTNKEEVFGIIEKSDLYITEKFPMPMSSSIVISKKSTTLSKIDAKLSDMQTQVINHKSDIFASETQFNNFKLKINLWCTELFKDIIDKLDKNTTNIVVVVNNKVTKHEWIFINWLKELSVNFLIVSTKEQFMKDTEIDREETYGTSEHIPYNGKVTSSVAVSSVTDNKTFHIITSHINYKSLDDIESSLYDKNETVKVIVNGTDNYIDTCNFYAKLNNKCQNSNDFVLADNGFQKPTYEQTSKFPRLNINKHDYILQTLKGFIKLNNKEYEEEISNIFDIEFNSGENKELTGQVLFNRMVYAICSLSQIYSLGKPHCIFYYGVASKNDISLLNILNKIQGLSLIVACPDKTKCPNVNDISRLELGNSIDIFPLPVVDKRDTSLFASTMAAQAERRVNETLYSGDTLGMYKPGIFRTCDAINFQTTYDEIKLWWNKDVYLRPGFEARGDKAIIPTIFRVIKGVNESPQKYVQDIQNLTYGKTILSKDIDFLKNLSAPGIHVNIRRGTDINGTMYCDQIPFFENGKLNKQRIMRDKNYQYGFLDYNKQNLILDKLELIINGDKVNQSYFENEQQFIDTVLNIGLNLNPHLLQYIQWFEFYTYNPNLILTLLDTRTLSINEFIILALLQSLGFDVLIYVPTCYSSIEQLAGQYFIYESHIIGEANYNINVDSLVILNEAPIQPDDTSKETKKKHKFLDALLGRE
jgi:hypothetical protein